MGGLSPSRLGLQMGGALFLQMGSLSSSGWGPADGGPVFLQTGGQQSPDPGPGRRRTVVVAWSISKHRPPPCASQAEFSRLALPSAPQAGPPAYSAVLETVGS